VKDQLVWWKNCLTKVLACGDPPSPPAKEFKPKVELPVLKCYRQKAPVEYWEKFPRAGKGVGVSLINASKLWNMAQAVGWTEDERLAAVCKDLTEGADIGCVGAARLPTRSGNAPTAYEFPRQVSDAIAQWVLKGFAFGPVKEEEVPAAAKVNKIMCREKPNGSVRIILNLSAPEGVSVNDGIGAAQSREGGLMTKLDWADAYKYIHVRKEDLDLQWFSWAGMYFAEKCLVFGAASSPGIYDRAAKVVLEIVMKMARFPADMVCQVLDDVCAAAPRESESIFDFERTYREVASEVGVRLASYDDREKAFAPCTEGVVLGVEYNTVDWTWAILGEKMARLVGQIRRVMEAVEVRQDEMWSLAGRIIHYAPLVPCGRFNIRHIIKANSLHEAGGMKVVVTRELKRQLHFWLVMIQVSTGHATIPRPEPVVPAWAREFFTDAAGGSLESVGRGCGGVTTGWWFYVPWPKKINSGVRAHDGKKLGRKMSALELVGPLVCVSAGYDMCRDAPVKIWVDNVGSVKIWRKGYSSSCDLCSTLVTAMATVAAALGCRLAVEKVTRCSSAGTVMADALSKAQFRKFREVAQVSDCGPLPLDPAWVPVSILAWLQNPRPDDDLGEKILRELAVRTAVLGYSC
jgi:hypothetical protein